MGQAMAAPFTPNPADSPSGRRPAGEVSAPPTVNHKLSHDQHGATPLAEPTPADFDPPTVISSPRPKRGTFDSRLGETLAGRKLGHFELIESVGAGGMGAVLKARDLDLGRVVALKILPPDMAADPENIVRFKQEARAAARLDHDNVARVYHFGEDQGLHYIAFEFVEGDNLRQMMEANGGTIPVPDAVALLLEVAAGLGHAAERGVVHRDIKPSNIIVTPDGRAKIVDMGLARSMDARHTGQLTESGVTLGTFDYISPEQAIEPRQADVRSDIYSLGCTFYHALTGRTPVPDGTAAKKLDAQRNLLAPDPRLYNPAIPEDLAAILGRMMAKDPDRRYQDAEHLAVHLRAVARKLGIATGPLSPPESKLDEPLPPPPRMSVAWVLTAVAVLALAIVIFSNAFHPSSPPPFLEEKPGTFLTEPIDPGPAAPVPLAVASRDASDTEELLALLRSGVQHIRLTGREYDLARYRDQEGQPVGAVLAGEDVRLEGVFEPIVRLGYSPDGKSRVKSLTLRGSGKGSVSVRGIHFLLPDADGDDSDCGLLVSGFENVKLDECTFSTGYRSSRDGPAGFGLVLRGGSATINKCYLAPGCVGFWIDGPGKVSVSECAIGPQFAGIRILRSSTDLSGEIELSLVNCSALLPTSGALVEVGDQIRASIVASFCLFAGPERQAAEDTPVVLRQKKQRAQTTKYEGGSDAKPNFYYNLAAYSEREEIYSFADAAKQSLPIHDVQRAIKNPWEDPDPFRLLKSSPLEARRAFTQNLRLAELRIKNDPNRSIVGARFLGPHPIFALPLRAPDSENRDPTVKVWDPSQSDTDDNLPPGVFPTLAKTLAALGHKGTLLIRHSGKLEVEPWEFTKAETNLTIKPDAGFKPILVPAAVALKPAAGLFKLYGGRLVLDGLHFRLPADRAPAIVVLPGGGQFELKNAVITLEDGEDLTAIKLVDPRGEMMMGGGTSPDRWPVPKMTVENVFLRGKGHLVVVRGSRPFVLDVKNTLAALDDTLFEIDPSTADPSSAGSGVIRLSRVTAYLGGSLLHFRASDRKTEMGPTGLTRTEIKATQCVFVPAVGTPDAFIRADRIDTREQAEKWLSFIGKNNVYGHDKKKVMLEIRPTNVEAMPIQPVEGDRWLAMTLEEGDPFVPVSFEYRLPEAGQKQRFLAVRPIEFRNIRFDSLRENFSEIGSTSEIPSPFADE